MSRTESIMLRLTVLLVSSVALLACTEKSDPLADIAQAKAALLACQNNQELPSECEDLEEGLRRAKLAALSAGHTEQTIVSAEKLGAESVKVHESPMEKVRAAFSSTWVPVEPEEIVFKLISKQFHCSNLKSQIEGRELYIWVARGVEDGKLLFAFAPFSNLKIKVQLAESGVEGMDPAPCVDINGIADGFAIVSEDQLSELEKTAPRVRGMEAIFRRFSSIDKASSYFSSELARHCLEVVPSVEGADVRILRDGVEVKNRSRVKKGDYSISVTKPGYLPFSIVQHVEKPTRVNAVLERATFTRSCEEARVVITSTRGATSKGNCAWEYRRKNNFGFDNEYSITVKNNSSARLFAVEYVEEYYDESGVKRSVETQVSTLNVPNDAVSDGTMMLFSISEKGIEALKCQGAVIEPNHSGRIDRQRFLLGRGGGRITAKVARYYFVENGAAVPQKKDGFGGGIFHFRPGVTECSVD